MNLNLKLVSLILLVSLSVNAQNETSKTGELPSSRWSVLWSPSKSNFSDVQLLQSEFQEKLDVEGLSLSDLQSEIYPNYNVNLGRSSIISHRLGAELKFKNGIGKKDINWSYRTDFQYRKFNGSQMNFAKGKTIILDSTYVSSLNSTVWRDSIYLNKFDAQVSQESFLWNNSLLLRFAENKRWSFYTGLQIGLQFNFSRRLEFRESNFAILDTYVSPERQSNRSIDGSVNSDIPNSQRTYKLSNSVAYHFAIPVGLDLRIGENRFWKHIHLYAEGTLGISTQKNAVSSFNFNQSFGLRYKF